jgi:phosphoenolpyruvate phosphomutase
MIKNSKKIFKSESIADIEDEITTVEKIFNLQGVDELSQAQKRYLAEKSVIRAIILAATRGSELHELTHDKPKTMIKIGGEALLARTINRFKKIGINKSIVVAGYKAKSIDISGIEVRINDNYEIGNELMSLTCAQKDFDDDMVITYGDLLFREHILRDLLEVDGDIVIIVDSALDNPNITGSPDFAYCSQDDDRSPFMQNITLKKLSSVIKVNNKKPSGYWIGMMRIRKEGRNWIESAIGELEPMSNFKKLTLPDLLNHIIEQGKTINVHYINGHWLDVNSIDDIDRAGDFTQ